MWWLCPLGELSEMVFLQSSKLVGPEPQAAVVGAYVFVDFPTQLIDLVAPPSVLVPLRFRQGAVTSCFKITKHSTHKLLRFNVQGFLLVAHSFEKLEDVVSSNHLAPDSRELPLCL